MISKDKILIIILLSIILLTASNVSASELNLTDDFKAADSIEEISYLDMASEEPIDDISVSSSVSDGEVSSISDDANSIDEDIVNNNPLSQSNNPEIVSNSPKTFNDLNNLINENFDTDVYLYDDYVYNRSTDQYLKSGIVITRPLTIHGNGHIINGTFNDEKRAFNVTSSNVTFINITFSNLGFYSASSEYDGGAIYSKKNLNTYVINSTFSNCQGNLGGAINWVHAENCTFFKCRSLRGVGGAMAYGNATNCVFNQNEAYDAGAAYMVNALYCSFYNNSALENGGALQYSNASYCIFENNTAALYGGAIHASLTYVSEIQSCIFIKNHAHDGGAFHGFGQISTGGSATVTQFGADTLINCTFINNSAFNRGGAVHGCRITLCRFINNTAQEYPDYFSEVEKASISTSSSLNFTEASEISLPVTVKYKNIVYYGINLTASVSQADQVVNYSCLSGSNFTKFLVPGTYNIKFTLGPEYSSKGEVANCFVKISGASSKIIVSNKTMDITVGEDSYFVATLLDSTTNEPLVNCELKLKRYLSRNLQESFTCITDEMGQIRVSLKNLPQSGYNHYVFNITFLSNGEYMNSFANLNVTVSGINASFNASDMNIMYNESAVFIGKFFNQFDEPIANAYINISLNRSTYGVYTDENGEFSLNLPLLPAGSYNLLMTFKGDNYTRYASKNINLTVEKFPTRIDADNLSIIYSDSAELLATLINDFNGQCYEGCILSVVVNGTAVNYLTDENGQIHIPVPLLDEGIHPIVLNFESNDFLNASSKTVYVNVTKFITIIDASNISILYNNTANLFATLLNESGDALSGFDLSVEFNGGTSVYRTGDDGSISIPIPILDEGVYPVNISFDSMGCYKSSSRLVYVNVSKFATSIVAEDMGILYGSSINLIATLLNESGDALSGFDLSVVINGSSSVYRTGDDGSISIPIPILDEGVYPVNISFDSVGCYKSSSRLVHVNVSKIGTEIEASNITVLYGVSRNLVVALLNESGDALSGFDLSVVINGSSSVYRTGDDGSISIPIPILDEGVYPVSISFDAVDYFSSSSKTVYLNVIKFATSIVAEDMSILYGSSINLIATLLNESGDALGGFDLSVEINGSADVYRSDNYGKIAVPIPLLLANTYPVTISFAGKDYYNGSSKTVNLTVYQIQTNIESSDVDAYYGEGKVIATLRNQTGSPLACHALVLSLNNQNQSLITDSNGQAIFALDDLASGDYNATLIFIGTELYKNATKVIKVNIKRFDSVLAANNVSYKYGESDQIIVKLTNSYGNPLINQIISLKNDFIDMNLTTNESGEAILVLDGNIMPNDYLLNISYAGNKTYLSSSVEARYVINKLNTSIFAQDLSTVYNSSDVFAVTLKDEKGNLLNGYTIKLNIEGLKYENITDGNGIAKFFMKLPAKTWNVNISFAENEIFHSSNYAVKITVRPVSSSDPIDNSSNDHPNGSSSGTSTSSGTSGNGGSSGISGGSSSSSSTSLSFTSHSSSSSKKISTTMVAPIVKTVYNSGAYFVATLKDKSGKPIKNVKVVIRIAGKHFYKTTDKNGKIRLLINFAPRKYYGTVYFVGNNKYSRSSADATVLISKIKPKLIAKNKAFKVKTNVKKYTVTLKNKNKAIKNAVLTVKIKGKTYKAKTNNKGKATFKIKNLKKKGIYYVYVKFKANKYYKFTGKLVKLTVN